jgi:hypothetical protein
MPIVNFVLVLYVLSIVLCIIALLFRIDHKSGSRLSRPFAVLVAMIILTICITAVAAAHLDLNDLVQVEPLPERPEVFFKTLRNTALGPCFCAQFFLLTSIVQRNFDRTGIVHNILRDVTAAYVIWAVVTVWVIDRTYS